MDDRERTRAPDASQVPDWAEPDHRLWQQARDRRQAAEDQWRRVRTELEQILSRLADRHAGTELRAAFHQLARDLDRATAPPPPTGHPLRDLLRRLVWRLTRPAQVPLLRVQQRTLELLDRLLGARELQQDQVQDLAQRLRSALEALRAVAEARDQEVVRETGFNVTLQSGRIWNHLREQETRWLPHIQPEAHRVEQLYQEWQELKQAWIRGSLPPAPDPGPYGRPLTCWEFPRARDFRYHVFAEIFRGPSEWLQEKLRVYEPIFRAAPEPILDIGCGRGEFLQWMRELGKTAYGIEINRYEVDRLRAAGLDVREEPVQHHLQHLKPHSVGGVFCAQVAEHLLPEDLYQTIAALYRVMKPGAPLVIETINPLSVYALHQIFFLDPTHIYPVHPETLVFFFRYAGFERVHMQPITPAPASLRLPEPPADRTEPHGAYLHDLVQRLNALFFDHLEYYVVGYRPGA